MSDQLECPLCKADLRGPQISDEHLHSGAYGEWDGKPRYFSRVIGVQIQGVYDGILFWQCPHCAGRWHRFSEDHPYRPRAEPYVDGLLR